MPARATDTDVVVVGAGPVGLLLAGELRLGGASVTVVEKLAEPATESRASTVHARTMELFAQRGLLKRLGAPLRGYTGHYAGIPLDLTLPSPYAGLWKVAQTDIEAMLQRWAADLGAEVRRRCELVGLSQKTDHVDVELATPAWPDTVAVAWIVGCDGEDSAVRDLAGFEFPGEDATREMLRADVSGIEIPDRRFERHPAGLAVASRGTNGVTRVMVHEYRNPARRDGSAPTFAEVVSAWAKVTGEDIGTGTPIWLNAFGNTRRQAARYRRGRIMLAGDAAHRQMPVGGQALNLGLQDAANLGWKLAAQVRGWAPEGLLDSYHDERHPVDARVLGDIAAQALLLLGDQTVEPVRSVLADLIPLEPVRAGLAGGISGLAVRYGQDDHPLVGTRMPHRRLPPEAGAADTFALLRPGRGVLLDTTGMEVLCDAARGWHDRVRTVAATREDLAGPDSVLIRPDGYVAWAGSDTAALTAALRRWFGQSCTTN